MLHWLNEMLRRNTHLVMMVIMFIIWTGREAGCSWSGSPRAVIAHVDSVGTAIQDSLRSEHHQRASEDSSLWTAVLRLQDTTLFIIGRQDLALLIICRGLTATERSVLAKSWHCQ